MGPPMLVQMLVLAALLALVGAESRSGAESGPSCSSGCRLANISITLERKDCGTPKTIQTTSCAGQCQTTESNIIQRHPSQSTCSFQEWSYKTYHFDGCEDEPTFTYPEAKSCECKACSPASTECDSLPMSSCFEWNL